jgi:hypothetical protein
MFQSDTIEETITMKKTVIRYTVISREIMGLLEEVGFDPYVGRKLYHYYRQSDFTCIEAHVFPHHVICGHPTEGERENWYEKIDTVEAFLSHHHPGVKGIGWFSAEMKALIDDPEVFTYSPLILMVGTT